MKRTTLRLSPHQFVETSLDYNGRWWVAYSGGASVFIRDVAELRRFLKLPKSLPMREALESWLTSLADMDANRKGAEAPVLSVATESSWDPVAHDDGPTRMIT